MKGKSHEFQLPDRHKSIIKVVGVGGGGSNAVNFMYSQGIQDVEFVVCNTDAQALEKSPVPNKLQIGTELTLGLGAGANPTKGHDAAIESEEQIREMLTIDNTKMVFITAGMGGGTGTGAAPVIARIAREEEILTVGIVTAPFHFEGPRKRKQAEVGIAEMKQYCDTVLVILNDKIREMFGDLAIENAYSQADMILTTAAKSIAEVITKHAKINLDFEDVKTVMKNSGTAVLGSAEAVGPERALECAKKALESPLLNSRDIKGAQKILLSVTSGTDPVITLNEFTIISEYMQQQAGESADIIYGQSEDPKLGGAVVVTVIATGFDDEESQKTELVRTDLESGIRLPVEKNTPVPATESAITLNISKEPLNAQPVVTTQPQQEITPPAISNISNDIASQPPVNEYVAPPKAENVPMRPIENQEMEHRSVRTPVSPESDRDRELRELKKKAYALEAELRRVQLNANKNTDPASAWENEKRNELDIPAYQRKDVKLTPPPHSSEKNVSRYTLGDGNDLTSTNKYLNDNVD